MSKLSSKILCFCFPLERVYFTRMEMEMEIFRLVAELGLQPHPEGGYFRETYRSNLTLPAPWEEEHPASQRSLSTAILFLITAGNFSAFHRIRSDECWHFYTGQSLLVHQISPDGIYTRVELGNRVPEHRVFQHVVPAGYWFASEVAANSGYALVGCTVSPGFDFRDFELAEREKLIQQYPDQSMLIERLTRI